MKGLSATFGDLRASEKQIVTESINSDWLLFKIKSTIQNLEKAPSDLRRGIYENLIKFAECHPTKIKLGVYAPVSSNSKPTDADGAAIASDPVRFLNFAGDSGFNVASSTSVLNSGRDLSVDAFLYPHDKIGFSISRGEIKSEKCVELYASGLSTAAIAKVLKMAKSSVIWHLRASGISLRPSTQVPEGKKPGTRNYHFGQAPFGYVHLDGQLVMDPKEMSVVHQVVGMWKSGMGTGDIMRKLNSSNIKTRHGGVWRYKSVTTIIKRECPEKNIPSKKERGK